MVHGDWRGRLVVVMAMVFGGGQMKEVRDRELDDGYNYVSKWEDM